MSDGTGNPPPSGPGQGGGQPYPGPGGQPYPGPGGQPYPGQPGPGYPPQGGQQFPAPGGPAYPQQGSPPYPQQGPPYPQQGQPYPQQGQPYPQQGYPGGPGEPPGPGFGGGFEPPRRRNGLLAALVAGVLVLAAVAVLVVVQLTGDDDPAPSAADPTTGPTTGPTGQTTGPTTDPTTGQTTGTEPTQTASGGPQTAPAETVTTALQGAGFACYRAVTSPVVVHRCYLEPLLAGQDGLYNEQRITIQSTGTGVKSVEVTVKVFDKPAAVTPVYTRAVQVLSGALLPAADVRTILSAAPAARKLKLTWGTADHRLNSKRDARTLTVVATGAREEPISFTKTKVTYNTLIATYARQGYRCTTKFTIRRCEITKGGVFYHVHASDPCQAAGPKLAKVCKGAPVYSVTMSIAFNTASDKLFQTILREFHAVATLTAGSPVPEADAWMRSRLTGKPYMADFGGLQYSILPGEGATNGQQNAVTLAIEGFNPV